MLRKLNVRNCCLTFPVLGCLHCHGKKRGCPQVKLTVKIQFVYMKMKMKKIIIILNSININY